MNLFANARIWVLFAGGAAVTAVATADPYPRAGWQAPLVGTPSHGVSGVVTIVDADTIQVDHFYYDGTGISVYFYLGADATRASFTNGRRIGPQLLGPAFVDASMAIDLPAGTTLDGANAISVWCEVVHIDFGSGTFVQPPPPPCPSDFNVDGVVDLADLGVILADFGCVGDCAADIDGDGDTDLSDLGTVLSDFGMPCQ